MGAGTPPWVVLVVSLVGRLALNSQALPIVDPGVFIIQGIGSCHNGTGYCMLGNDCTADIDFMATDATQHCEGLLEAFTPSVPFTCCQFNERGKASSEAPTTEISAFTITGDDLLLEEIPILEHQETNEIPEGADPSSLIDIIGVITDMTGVLGLITQPYTRPLQTTAATTLTSTTTTPSPGIPIQTNSSHASISLVAFLNRFRATTSKPSTTTTKSPATHTATETQTFTFVDTTSVGNLENQLTTTESVTTTASSNIVSNAHHSVTNSASSNTNESNTSAQKTFDPVQGISSSTSAGLDKPSPSTGVTSPFNTNTIDTKTLIFK